MSKYTEAPEIEIFKGLADPELPVPDWERALWEAQTPAEVAAAALLQKRHRVARLPRVAYSEDQPRDAHGRFGEGGGESRLPKPPDTTGEQMARLQAAFPNARIIGDEREEPAAIARAERVIMQGTVTEAERLAEKYPDVAASIKTIAFGEGQNRGSIGEYMKAGLIGEALEGGLYRTVDTPMIKLDMRLALNETTRDDPMGGVADAMNPERYGEGIFAHEFGHAVDYAATPGGGTADDLYWSHVPEMAPGEPRHISDYAMTQSHDYFAEAFTANELGYAERLDDADRAMLAGAGVQAAAPPLEREAGGIHSDVSFKGSIVEEYARHGRARVAYSEDQPRDAHGRFGEGTHTPAEDTEWHRLTSQEQTNLVIDMRTANPDTQTLDNEYLNWESQYEHHEDAAIEMKQTIATDIGSRILADPAAAAALERFGQTLQPTGEMGAAASFALDVAFRRDSQIDDVTVSERGFSRGLAEFVTTETALGMTRDEYTTEGRALAGERATEAFHAGLEAAGIPEMLDRYREDPESYNLRDILASTEFQRGFAESLNGAYAQDSAEKQADAWASWVLGRWADSASDNGTSLALQQSVSDTFGVSPRELDDAVTAWQTESPHEERIAERGDAWTAMTTGDGRTLMDATAHAMYTSTQERLQALGIENLHLWRGYWASGAQSEVVGHPFYGLHAVGYTVTMNPVSSWSTSDTVASGFGPIEFDTAVPAERVFATSMTGIGSLSEREVTILGDPIDVMSGAVG